MSQADHVELNFRYRPKQGTNDAALVKFLNAHKPRNRKRMILTALRYMYAIDALTEFSEIDSVEDLSEVVENLKEIYGKSGFKKGFGLEINITGGYGEYSEDSYLEDGSADLTPEEKHDSRYDNHW